VRNEYCTRVARDVRRNRHRRSCLLRALFVLQRAPCRIRI